MLNQDITFNEFQYVVEKVKPQRICFGSSLKRNTNPIGNGLSSFQKRYATEINPRVTPASYNLDQLTSGVAAIGNKIRSNRGVGTVANRAPRWSEKILMRVPSPTRYTVEPFKKTFSKSFVPFTYKLGKQSMAAASKTPGPGMYNVEKVRCRRTNLDFNFGIPKLVPAVEVECNPVPTSKCNRCGNICNDDYWHINYTKFLCHLCMEEEKVLREDFTMSELKKFNKIRICSYKHSHEGVPAYKQLWTDRMLKKRDRLENYLNLYLTSFK